jgi:hypothetical protein
MVMLIEVVRHGSRTPEYPLIEQYKWSSGSEVILTSIGMRE